MLSPLHKKRMDYKPVIPILLQNIKKVHFKKQQSSLPIAHLKKLFPHTFHQGSFVLEKGIGKQKEVKIGVVFSGGQAAGGHNVIGGIFDAGAEVIGFLNGPSGVVENKFRKIDTIDLFRNQGGFDLLGSGRTKIETEEQLAASLKTALFHKLDGLVIIGGDDSNTNAAVLAEYFFDKGCKTCVVGVPKTIDGDLRSADIELSFGFDSACKTYSEIIGNIAKDALSSKKYYHFIKLMGRSASHIALECALKTQPNITLIAEERKSLKEIIGNIVDVICRRFEKGKEYGMILIPEGLVEFIPEFNELVKDFNLEKDPHGNVQVSKIATEELIIAEVKKELEKRKFKGNFNAQGHFLGYEGRSCMPSNFDANYCYSLGLLSFLAVREELTGVICSIQNLRKKPSAWQLKMVPILQLMHMESRLGKEKPVIRKVLVDMKSKSFVSFSALKKDWEIEDQYLYPGPIQFFGPEELTDSIPHTLME
jgi:pyrophosphate--fructose-6-phosphate 1-phosphotransferase